MVCSYICGLTFNYICKFYRRLKYLFCFQCIPLPRQLVKHRTKQKSHWAEIVCFLMLPKFKFCFWVSSPCPCRTGPLSAANLLSGSNSRLCIRAPRCRGGDPRMSLRLLRWRMEEAGPEGRAALCFSAGAAGGGTHHPPSYTFAVPVTLGAKLLVSGK